MGETFKLHPTTFEAGNFSGAASLVYSSRGRLETPGMVGASRTSFLRERGERASESLNVQPLRPSSRARFRNLAPSFSCAPSLFLQDEVRVLRIWTRLRCESPSAPSHTLPCREVVPPTYPEPTDPPPSIRPLPKHATRVSAISTELLQHGHSITIVTNAPPLPFASILSPSLLPPSSIPDSVASSNDHLIEFAQYRNRNVDAGIVQPKAYDVDRQKTLEGLQGFLYERDTTLKEEVKWLKSEKIDAVLSDATFLGW